MTKNLGHIEKITPLLLGEPGGLTFTVDHNAGYLAPPVTQTLSVTTLRQGTELYAVISQYRDDSMSDTVVFDTLSALEHHARKRGTEVICLTQPLHLQPVSIPKPWGQEIWYSGIEARGVSTVSKVPLSWITDVFGELLACPSAPMLLKILDPYPANNVGDLYFEMHAEKIEVYIVTHVDQNAWPNGKGQIRYGFNQQTLRGYSSKKDFLEAYVAAVAQYQRVRNKIDALLLDAGAADPAQNADAYHAQLSKLPENLLAEEQRLRDAMYRFTAIREIEVGDVITVHPFFPHSLQHGVRVIEFQTPHYERFILSFGQRVQTQDHWDTEKAMSLATTETPVAETPKRLESGAELIADFTAFAVMRVVLAPNQSMTLTCRGYTLLIGITGEPVLTIEGSTTRILSEQAFLQAPIESHSFTNNAEDVAIVLVAEEVTVQAD